MLKLSIQRENGTFKLWGWLTIELNSTETVDSPLPVVLRPMDTILKDAFKPKDKSLDSIQGQPSEM